jgi:uncharacterized protein YaaQ
MKMVVAVVRDEYAALLTERLTQKGYGATKLASTGGFLKAGNTTFLIGTPLAQLDDVLSIIKATCPSKKSVKGDLSMQEGSLKSMATNPSQPIPTEVAVSGATVFVLDVERMVKA